MQIPHQLLSGYLAGMEAVSVRQQCGAPGFEASRSEALMLVSAGVVEGRGTRKRLKCLFLTVPMLDAMEKAQGQAKKMAKQGNKASVRLMALDALQRMVSDRKFIVREWMTNQRGQRTGKWIFQHKATLRALAE